MSKVIDLGTTIEIRKNIEKIDSMDCYITDEKVSCKGTLVPSDCNEVKLKNFVSLLNLLKAFVVDDDDSTGGIDELQVDYDSGVLRLVIRNSFCLEAHIDRYAFSTLFKEADEIRFIHDSNSIRCTVIEFYVRDLHKQHD